MPPTYIFIRHGEALHNIANRIHGPIAYTFKENEDAPLSEEGVRQTTEAGIQIAKYIGDVPVELYSSPLTRCIQTAENVAKSLTIKNRYMDDLLIERLGGGHVCNNRKSFHELNETYPEWNVEYVFDPPSMPLEREELEVVSERMGRFWNSVQEIYKNTDDVVVIVSHQESLTALHGRNFKNAEFLVVNQ